MKNEILKVGLTHYDLCPCKKMRCGHRYEVGR